MKTMKGNVKRKMLIIICAGVLVALAAYAVDDYPRVNVGVVIGSSTGSPGYKLKFFPTTGRNYAIDFGDATTSVDDTISMFAGADTIDMGAGDDILQLDGSNDTGADQIKLYGGADTIDMGAGDDILKLDGSSGDSGLDMIMLYGGNDTINLGEGNDCLAFASGIDQIRMGAGADVIMFGYEGEGENEPAIMTFDPAGYIADMGVFPTNSQEYIRSDSPQTKTGSQIKVRSHDIVLSSHGGNVIIDLGDEY